MAMIGRWAGSSQLSTSNYAGSDTEAGSDQQSKQRKSGTRWPRDRFDRRREMLSVVLDLDRITCLSGPDERQQWLEIVSVCGSERIDVGAAGAPGSIKLVLPQVKRGIPIASTMRSAAARLCRPLPFGKAWMATS